jgi:hypothetical protein
VIEEALRTSGDLRSNVNQRWRYDQRMQDFELCSVLDGYALQLSAFGGGANSYRLILPSQRCRVPWRLRTTSLKRYDGLGSPPSGTFFAYWRTPLKRFADPRQTTTRVSQRHVQPLRCWVVPSLRPAGLRVLDGVRRYRTCEHRA